MRINVIGLGKLGLVLAAIYAKAGHDVVGVDQDQERISYLDAGTFHSIEPGLEGLLAAIREDTFGTLAFRSDYDGVVKADATFIVVPTPSLPDGSYNLSAMLAAVTRLAANFKGVGGHDFHQVIIVSTVNPGDMKDRIMPLFYEKSGRSHNNTGFIYSPEFIALGDVVEGMQRPDLVLVGSDCARDHDRFVDIASSVCKDAPFYGTTHKNAELAKVALNSFITMKISYANQIADICEKFEGGNADAVLQIVGADRRVGHLCLRPGGPFGGPCFPRDNRALLRFANTVGTIAPLAAAVDEVNDLTYQRVVTRIHETFENNPKLSRLLIFGRTYKPGTDVTDESLGEALTNQWQGYGGESWDPVLDRCDPPDVGPEDLVVLATPGLVSDGLTNAGVVFDVWGTLRRPGPNVITMGRG